MINNTKVSIIHGEITREKADAIVNSTNCKLAHCGGTALHILQVGGDEIQVESSDLVSRLGDIKAGEIAVTGAGKLKNVKHIIHAVAPLYRDGADGEDDTMRTLLKNIYKEADERELKTISIPSIGTGVANYPKDDFARILFDTLTEWLQTTETTVTEIRLTNKDLVTVKYLSREFLKRFYIHGDRIQLQRSASAAYYNE